MPLSPLRKKRATDEVYDSIRAAILTRLFEPGQRLKADALAEQLGVSLTPVRHALSQLAVEGLIEIHPRSGTYVASVSAAELEETFEIRVALETLAAARAVERLTAQDLAEMRAILERLAETVRDEEGMKRHEAANLDFHRKLLAIAGSKRLLEMYETLNAHIQIARIHAAEGPNFPRLKARLEQEHEEHTAIVEALGKKSAAKLQAALKQHILRAQESLVRALGGEGKGAAHEGAKNGKAKRV